MMNSQDNLYNALVEFLSTHKPNPLLQTRWGNSVGLYPLPGPFRISITLQNSTGTAGLYTFPEALEFNFSENMEALDE